jgi:hypothetical protein
VQRDDGSWLISGSMPADEMADRYPSHCRRTAAIIPPPVSCSVSSGTCRIRRKF